MNESQFLKFNGYEIEQIRFSENKNFIRENSNIIPKFAFGLISSKENNKKYNVIIGVFYEKEDNQPFLLNLIVRGFFEIGELGNTQILTNAFAILFPYVRSIITDITKHSIVPLILPTINIAESIKNLDAIMIDSENFKDPK